MRIRFREAFYGGLAVALLIGIFLMRLWQPERQLQLHSKNLLQAIEKKNWGRFSSFIGSDYEDQWGNDHALILERTREVFRYVRTIRLSAVKPTVWTANQNGYWKTRITIDGDNGEVTAMLKERVNSIAAPFQLEWRRISARPWDWKLVRISNAELQIPEYTQ